MNTRSKDVPTILGEALEIASPGAREVYLERVCGGDAGLRRRVDQLLDDHAQAGDFLEQPVLLATLIVPQINEGLGTMIGPYKLREQLGEGGMGVVYVAEQERPVRRKVALKVIKPGMDSREVIARFEAERQALALMDHPNIAKVLDAGTTEDTGRPYFVMELVRGIPITDYCDKCSLPPRERLKLFIQVCQAVQHAHQKGVIHRDLKPSNVLVTLHDGVPVTKVIDFGVAKAINQRLTEHTVYTRHAQMVGTPMYMSPEQAELSGLDIDTRSDVYSLGVLLYVLLAGATPFDKESFSKVGFDEMRRMIREDEPPRPSQRVSTLEAKARSTVSGKRGIDERKLTRELQGELDWIVMKALEKDRQRRYESASALAADIQRYLADEPVAAGPPSASYRLRKFARRNKTAAIVAAIVSVTILSSSAFSALKYFDERQARQDADEQKLVAIRNAEKAESYATEATRQKGKAVRQKAEVERQRDAARQNLYYADTRLAFVDLGQGNAGRARDILLSHFPHRGDSDCRGWEWHYLLGRSEEAEHTLYGHRGDVLTVAWSPDGNIIASVSYDGSAKLWDTRTWKLIRTFAQGPNLKQGVQWSPDSRKLAWGSVSDESALRIWNRDTDQIAVLHGHRDSVWAVAWSHDGKHVATGSIHLWTEPHQPGNVRIWDVEKLESVAQFTSASNVNSISWSSDDKLLVIADGTDGPTIWDISAQEQVGDVIMEHAACATWHPFEPRLVVGDALGGCLLWDHRTQTVISRWKAHHGEVCDVEWSADGSQLISSSRDGMVKVWNPVEGRELRSMVAHAGSANSISWDPSGRRFTSGGTDHVIRVWTAEGRATPILIDTRLQGNLNLAWNNDSSSLWLACGAAGTVVAFDASSGKKLEEIPLEQTAARRLVSFRHVVVRSDPTAIDPAKLLVSDVPAGGSLGTAVPPAVLNSIGNDAVLSPDRTRIAYLSLATFSRLAIRDIHSDRVVIGAEIIEPSGIAWSPNGQRIAVVGRGDATDNGMEQHAGWVHIFSTDLVKRVRKFRIGANRVPASAVGWSHDGCKIAAGTEQGLCEIWEWESGRKLVSERIHSSRVNDLAWSPDDSRVASGGINEQIHLWDSVTGQQLLALEPHKSPIRRIRWSPDGRKLAAVSDNGVIQVWDASDGYELPQRESWRRLIEPREWKEYDRLTGEQRWLEAADLLKEMLAGGIQDEVAIYRLALVNLQVGDKAAYRDACQRMLAAFAKTEERWEAYRTAWACALRPAAVADYRPAIALAQRAFDLNLNTRNPLVIARADYAEALGAILFRAGSYGDVLRHLQAAHEAEPNRKTSPARICYLLAMTHQRLGHAADAQMWLERANQDADKELSDSVRPPTWDLRLTLKLFKSEATELIGRPVP